MYVRWIGLNEFVKRILRNKRPIVAKEMKKIATKGTEAIRSRVPEKTGKLKASVKLQSRDDLSFEIVEGTEYGRWVRLRTKPHLIPPATKKALFWPGLERPVALAHHPGIAQPKDYITEGLNGWNSWMPSDIRQMLDYIVIDIVG